MATAAMHHIMPKLHIGSRDKEGRKEERNDSANSRAREEEKSRLVAWESQKEPLEYEQILVEPNSKPVGHSSKVLRREDFELIKTLGTGMHFCQILSKQEEWNADQTLHRRHFCPSMASEPGDCEQGGRRQSICSQDLAKDRRCAQTFIALTHTLI